ncbi:MAG TPA: hypothetical protein VG405_09560 [Solirubrobacteraceae bacterium]|jgi:hypothetical protein|nr:hypothetical protein [Solirubrobacteraceae bacterium]
MRKRAAAVAVASVVAAVSGVAGASAATGAPAPKTYQGAKVAQYATGQGNLTSFAWLNGTMFAGDSGNSQSLPNGGLDVIKNHVVVRIPSPLVFVAGLAVRNHVLYISGAQFGSQGPEFQILAWSGWNGATFTHQRVVYTGPQGFQGFNGLAFAPNGRLLVGVDVGLLNGNDHGPASTSPYVYDILSMNTSGKNVKVFAKGIRQPWQMAFAKGDSSPFVSALGQDCTGANPCASTAPPANVPDFILHVKQGQNYGFPKCNRTKGSPCKGYAKPFKTLRPHFDPMGIAVVGKTLYITSFLGPKFQGGALYSMPITGGKLKPVVTGFPAGTDALAAHSGALFVGGSTEATNTGVVYKVTLKKATKKSTHKKHKKSTGPTFTG